MLVCGCVPVHRPVLGTPLQLVDAQGETLVLVEQNVHTLKAYGAALDVVAVVGPFHSGKSYLLNRIMGLGEGAGFDLGYTVDPTTKGIWYAC